MEVLQDFWKEFSANVERVKNVKIADTIDKLNTTLETFLFQKDDGSISRQCPECKVGELSLKIGRFGSFIGCSRYPDCNYVKKLDSSLSVENNETAMKYSQPKFLGNDPSDNSEISLKQGPYGFYVQKDQKYVEFVRKVQKKTSGSKNKPLRASIPSFMDHANINLEDAISLLQLPRTLGQYDGKDVKVGIGKFGPYVLFEGKYVSAPKSKASLVMTLNDAVELITNKQKR